MRGMMKRARRVSGGATARICTSFLAIAVLLFLLSTSSFGADPSNKLVSVAMEAAASSPTVLVQTTEPVGYRYTVYDSYDPIRVVVDFPGMDMTDVKDVLPVNQGAVQEVRVATFELSSGNLARVEVLLKESADYQVLLDGNQFKLVFEGQAAVVSEPVAAPEQQQAAEEVVADTAATQPVAASDAAASVLREVVMTPGQAVLAMNGEIDRYKYFALASPPRLVVDLYGIRPGFKQRSFPAEAGMSQLRVGIYKDKTRLVFDSENEKLPKHTVTQNDSDLAVAWSDTVNTSDEKVVPVKEPVKEVVAAASPVTSTPEAPAIQKSAESVAVEAVDFESLDGRSYLKVTLTSPAEVSGPTREGNLIRFEVQNATISRALRRTLDTAAFPTAIDAVTPYIVKAGDRQDVRFAVTMKGAAAYSLEEDGAVIRLVVDDGAYAEAMPPQSDVVEVEAPEVTADAEASAMVAGEPTVELDEAALAEVTAEGVYSGQKISLVFDSADVRSILQLIGDVSGLNILASDDVKGSITLRLIDVPWDQALELILETSDLGKIRNGNVLRIMPKDKIRDMANTSLQAQKQEIEEAPLVSRVFQISYSSVADMEKVITDLLTERGNIIPDARNKQLIVKDVPSVLDEMGALIMQIDKPEKQVLIEARIVEANTTFARDLGVKWGGTYQNDEVGVGTTNIDSASVGLGGSYLITTPTAGSVGSAGAAVGIGFGTVGVDTLTMDLRLSALESSGEGRIVSTPRVTTLNGESAKISQGTKIPYTTVGDAGTETSFESAELKLEVTPEINPDGSVILEIDASNSAVGTIVPTGTGNMVSIDEKKAQTKVLVRDGETTVIGGIFVETEQDADTGVPLLKDIPLLGHLFKSTTKTKERRELLIFITPRILE